MRVLLIYTGDHVPKYVLNNLFLLRKAFPNIALEFISDSAKAIDAVNQIEVPTWKCDNPEHTYSLIKDKLTHPMEFRDAFWFHTLARLLIVRDFMRSHPGESVLQIECDNWIAPDFPFSTFEELEKGLAFPLLSNGLGVGSIIYIRDLQSAEVLSNYVTHEVLANSQATDMNILGNLAKLRQDLVYVLPTRIPSEPFVGLFDAADWGMYLFGEDPRNHQGTLKLFNTRYAGQYTIRDGNSIPPARPTLKLVDRSVSYPLYCLHIHSKDRRIFKTSSERRVISLRLKQSLDGPRETRLWFLTMRLAYLSVKRRICS